MHSKLIWMPFFLILINCHLYAQQSDSIPPIPAMRQLHHEYILRALAEVAVLKQFSPSLDSVAIQLGEKKINQFRSFIELNSALNNNDKYTWLRGVNDLLTAFISAFKSRLITSNQYLILIGSYDTAMQLTWQDASMQWLVKSGSLELGSILVNNFALQQNRGLEMAKDALVVKLCEKNPDNILSILSKNSATASADSLIVKAAFKDPEALYNYAAAPDKLGKKIQSVNHPFVSLLSRLALTRTGRMYFPFLDQLYKGNLTMDSIAKYVGNDTAIGYYKLLVKTRIEYAARMQQGDTPMAVKILTNKLKSKGTELFINEINALHAQKSDAIRFKKIELLSPTELYYLAVLGEEEMYTSSFVSGIYPRIFSKMRIPRSDTLLQLVSQDYYKKFIKISAAYNKLDDFLSRMDSRDAEALMKRFVSKLDETNTLEDAVDIADSYASIYNGSIRKLILNKVEQELLRCKDEKQKRGQVIYGLLYTIFTSLDSTNKKTMSATLNIPPVFELPYKNMRDSITGTIAMQLFFYGDKDGNVVFNAFLNKFSNPVWKITRKSQWVEIVSVKGMPITIFANLPLDETFELDEKSQDSLIAYLNDNHIHPSIVVHRGHSYYLNRTIEKMPSSAKLVLLGSCGGYQKLHDVLAISPGAHIISSKQIGTGIINQGLINTISEQLRLGKDLNWPEIWSSLSTRFSGTAKEKFDDYVPPHKNLGAILITAYQAQMQE
ncbi:MAG: hypothetical protein EAZ35_03480 [Sphingobacteriia bacterium]|nr:MAG: hypothetical protein EAZ35_03480 [Sphingobacteriia bacterium]